MLQKALHKFIHSLGGRLLLHLLYWIAAALFLVYFFGHFTADYRYTSIFVCLLMPIAVGTTYLLNYFLIPRYLLRKRYGRFAWYFMFTMIISVWGEMLVVVWAFIELADYSYKNMPPITMDIFSLFVGLYFLVFFSTSIKLLKHWYKGQQHLNEVRQKQLEAELKLREAELQLLKGQIHPHFLFNTLNNLYGLALEKSDQMPDAILRLSGLLDALLYRSHHQSIPLATELKLIEDYVSLEKLRFEERLELDWKVNGPMEAYSIAPFLLFPFIENAFKHGFSENANRLQLLVEASVEENQLQFKVVNSIASVAPSRPLVAGGIGLKNVKRRLNLQYPSRHRLSIKATDVHFQVELQLSLSTTKPTVYAT